MPIRALPKTIHVAGCFLRGECVVALHVQRLVAWVVSVNEGFLALQHQWRRVLREQPQTPERIRVDILHCDFDFAIGPAQKGQRGQQEVEDQQTVGNYVVLLGRHLARMSLGAAVVRVDQRVLKDDSVEFASRGEGGGCVEKQSASTGTPSNNTAHASTTKVGAVDAALHAAAELLQRRHVSRGVLAVLLQQDLWVCNATGGSTVSDTSA